MYSGYREFEDFASSNSSNGGGGADRGIQDITDNVQHFCKNVATLEQRCSLLNTRQDNSRLRQEIIDLVNDTAQLAKIADSSIKKLKLRSRTFSPSEKLQFDRLVNTFSNSLVKFQNIQQSTADMEQELLTRARSASLRKHSPDPGGSSLPESERDDDRLLYHDSHAIQSQQYADLEDETLQVEQREREVRQLESDIVGINDIFRDLATLVNEQGEIIDSIESNVETAATRVETGNKQLERAVVYKRCSRKLTCAIVSILIGVLIAIIVIILIALAVTGNLGSKR